MDSSSSLFDSGTEQLQSSLAWLTRWGLLEAFESIHPTVCLVVTFGDCRNLMSDLDAFVERTPCLSVSDSKIPSSRDSDSTDSSLIFFACIASQIFRK